MFKLRDHSPGHVAHCKQLLDGLPPLVPEIRRFDVGVNVIDSPRSWDLVLVSAFDDAGALARYQVHPAHAEVQAYLRDSAEAVAVVDFEAGHRGSRQ
jgi:hypothetical protein